MAKGQQGMMKHEFSEEMTKLIDAFGKKTTGPMLDAYFDQLQHCRFEDFQYAVTRILQDEAMWPKVPKILEYVGVRERQGRYDPNADSKTFSFHCSCGDRFSVIKDIHFAYNRMHDSIACDCGKSWAVPFMQSEMNRALALPQHYADLP
jgi:hypothetical protein